MSEVALRPIGNKIAIKKTKQEVVKGSIIDPEGEKEQKCIGVVVAIGKGKPHQLTGEEIKIDVELGQTVIFAKHAGQDITVKGVEYTVIREEDLLTEVL